MIARLKGILGRIRFPSLQRGDFTRESKQPIENTDALTLSGMRRTEAIGMTTPSAPPGWVPPTDEGRPRH